MVVARIPMEVGGRRRICRKPLNQLAGIHSAAQAQTQETRWREGTGPYKSEENKDTGLLENY